MSDYGYGAPEEGGGAYLRGIEILIAEDNDFARALLRGVLKTLGADRLHYCNDGQEALSTVRNFPIDIALIDWEMPQLDGLEFTRVIRMNRDSPNEFLPIIMISSYAEAHQVLMARDAGVNEYLIKPYSAHELLKRIHAAVERPRSYVKTATYFGPDRRRKRDWPYKGRERREVMAEAVSTSDVAC